MKKDKKTFYTLLYIVGFISIWLLPLQAFGSIKLDGKRLSAKNGLSCNTVNDIIQDRDGFIWLGTQISTVSGVILWKTEKNTSFS